MDPSAAAERQVVRQLARAETEANIERLKMIAGDPNTLPADRIRAMRVLGELAGMLGRERPDEIALLDKPMDRLTREDLALLAYREAQAFVQRRGALRTAIEAGDKVVALAMLDSIAKGVGREVQDPLS